MMFTIHFSERNLNAYPRDKLRDTCANQYNITLYTYYNFNILSNISNIICKARLFHSGCGNTLLFILNKHSDIIFLLVLLELSIISKYVEICNTIT